MNPQNNVPLNNPIPQVSNPTTTPIANQQPSNPVQGNMPTSNLTSSPVPASQSSVDNPAPIGAVNLVEQIIKELELQNFPAEQQKEIVDKMTEIVLSRVSIRLTDQMTDEELDEFEKVVDEGGMEKGLHYLAQIFPNIPGIIQDELAVLQKEVKSDLSNMQTETVSSPAQIQNPVTPPNVMMHGPDNSATNPLTPIQPIQPVQPIQLNNYPSTPMSMPANMPPVQPMNPTIQSSPYLPDEGGDDLNPSVESIVPDEE